MTIATTLLATAHTLGQVRNAALESCVSSSERRDAAGNAIGAEYRFGDQSTIVIVGRKILTGRWVYVEEKAVDPVKRRCTSPDCWACKGTGLDDAGNPCITNDEVPF